MTASVQYNNSDAYNFKKGRGILTVDYGERLSRLAYETEVQPFLFKDTRNKIVEVKVDGLPASCQKDPKEEAHLPEQSTTEEKSSCVRILVELRMTNGLHISQKNLNYQELKRLTEKLEGLCLM